jgi:glycosyltransferase involved in cell wall biosynthesis
MPRVSIIVPAYNQGRYLGDAIRTGLGQTCSDLEVLVVDDGSTDDTREVAYGFLDPRVRYIRQENQGLSAARNTGIRHARGAFLTYLDSDDQFLPDKLEILLGVLEQQPEVGFVSGQAILIDEDGRPLGERFERAVPGEASDWLLGNPLHVGSVMVRREWQERVGMFDETLRSYEDWDMWLRLARAGCPMHSVRHPVSLYRFHGSQMTRVGRQMTTATFAVLDKTFADPDLSTAWRSRRDEAYSRAYLRAAAQAYTARDFPFAKECMANAVRLNPSLCADQAEPLARLTAGWANHAKTSEPMRFLASIYEHLPEDLDVLHRRRRRELARQGLHLAFDAYDRGLMRTARWRFWQAMGYQPNVLLSPGVLPALVKSLLRFREEPKPERSDVRQAS